MSRARPASVDDLSLNELRGLVVDLLARVSTLEEENAALKDEVARRSSKGMEKATSGTKAKTGRKRTKRKRCRRSPEAIEERKLSANAPLGSRFKGYDDFVVQDLRLEGRATRYRRERWATPDGKLIKAALPSGLRGHFGPDLVRFILLQYDQGQVTADRITILSNAGLGLVISKRRVLRLLRGDAPSFADAPVLC